MWKKLKTQYDIDQLKWEYENLTELLEWYYSAGDHSQQVCLQSIEGDSDPYKNGCGSMKRHPNRKEEDYVVINDKIKGTVFADIISTWVRSRFMTMGRNSTYSVHSDKSPRFHLAIDTHEHAYFFWPAFGKIFHIPADGHVYWIDTRIPHTFINCGPPRTHLVGVESDLYGDI